MPAEYSDIERVLFIQFKNGSEAAFQKIFDLHYRRILFFAERYLGDKTMAEDIAAESFLKVWENRRKIINSYAMIGYLQTVTRNACIDQLKKNNRKATAMRELGFSQDTAEDGIHTDMVRTELLENAWRLARTLPPSTRKVFDLYFGEGLSVQEIASKLGVSVNTVKTQRRNALQKIREIALRRQWLLIIPFCQSFL